MWLRLPDFISRRSSPPQRAKTYTREFESTPREGWTPAPPAVEASSSGGWDVETSTYDLGPYPTLRALNSDVANQIVMGAALNWERLGQRLVAHSHAIVTSIRDDGSIEFYASVITTYLPTDGFSRVTDESTNPD